MRLACVSVSGKGLTDACLARAVALMQARGLRLAGTVQSNPQRADRARCDMDVHILPDGPILRISEDRGPLARGCRLDAGVLEAAVATTFARLDGADLLVVNKFGKQEAGGRGFVPLIAEALMRGLPVLVGVNPLNHSAFRAFADGMAQDLAPDPETITGWALAQCHSQAVREAG